MRTKGKVGKKKACAVLVRECGFALRPSIVFGRTATSTTKRRRPGTLVNDKKRDRP
jgi:hypothetical protein